MTPHVVTPPSPADLQRVPDEQVPSLIVQYSAALAVLGARLASAQQSPPATDQGPQLLDVTAAATVLGVSRRWLYKNAHGLPFTRKIGRCLRFDRAGLHRYLSRRPPGSS